MTTSANKGYSLQSTGSNVGTWGDGPSTSLNQGCFQIIDANIGGTTFKSLTNVNVVLSATEAQNLNLVLSGVLSGNVQITTSAVGMTIVDNLCTGAFTVTFIAATGSAVTIANGSKYLIMIDATYGARQVGAGLTSLLTGWGLTGGPITSSGTASISTSAPPYGFDAPINLGLTASVAANALTIAIKDQSGADPSSTSPVLIPFRNVTASTGTPSWLSITGANSLTISSGSTLGTSNSTPFRVWVVLFNDGSTLRLGVINCFTSSGVTALYEGALTSSTSEGGVGGADSAGIIYTGTAVTSKAYRILGYMEYTSGLATVGTWNAAPDIVQLFGPGIKKPGDPVQVQISSSSSVSSGTSIIPVDDTIPQNTEGTQFLTLALTPLSPSNRLMLNFEGNFALDTAMMGTVALFQDSTADALAASIQTYGVANNTIVHPLTYSMRSGTSSPTTFKIRGGNQSGSVTMTMNGFSAARKLGGVLFSRLTVTEIMA